MFATILCWQKQLLSSSVVPQYEQQAETTRVKTSQVAERLHTGLIHRAKNWMVDCVTHILFLLVLTCVTSMMLVNFPPKSSEKSLFSLKKAINSLTQGYNWSVCVTEVETRWHMDGSLLWSVLSLPGGHQGSASWTNPLLPHLRGHGGGLGLRSALQELSLTHLWCLCEKGPV